MFFLFVCVGSVCRDWLTFWKTCLKYLCQNTYIVVNRSEIHIKNLDYTEQDVFLESSKGRFFFRADVAPHVDPLLLPRGNRFEYVTATKASGNC